MLSLTWTGQAVEPSFTLSAFTSNLDLLAQLSMTKRCRSLLASGDEYHFGHPSEVSVGHDGSTPVGKLSAQNVGRTVDDRSISRSTEPGKNALRPGARSNKGIWRR